MKTKETSKLKDFYQRNNKLTVKEQALTWWKQLCLSCELDDTHYVLDNLIRRYIGFERKYHSLTSKEIEEIYNKEVLEPKRQEEWQESQVNRRYSKPNQKQFSLEPEKQQVVDFEPKKNQKQFKQFSLEHFKSDINKFSDEDLHKALIIIGEKLNSNGYLKDFSYTQIKH